MNALWGTHVRTCLEATRRSIAKAISNSFGESRVGNELKIKVLSPACYRRVRLSKTSVQCG